MTYLVAFIILTKCLLVQGNLEWKVLKKITEYGQNVTLVCNVSNCCPKSAGWDKYTPQQRTIIIDVKTWRPNKKYDGYVLTDGYTLVIRNLTKQDLNIAYSCVYDFSLGDQQYLLEENVFDYISTTHQNSPFDNRTFSAGDIITTQQNGQIGNQTFSAGTIAGIILGVSTAMLVAIVFIICFWKRRKERHRNTRNSIEGSSEDVPLIEPPTSIDTYMDAIRSRKETRQYVRIQVIGKDRVGKTSLVRRLLFLENGAYDGKSTDGIEINRRCQIRRNDGKWFVGEVDTQNKEILKRMQLALYTEQQVLHESCEHLGDASVPYVLETRHNKEIPTTSQEYISGIEKKQNGQKSLLSNKKDIDTEKLGISLATNNADVNILRNANKMEKQANINLINHEVPDVPAMSVDQITKMMIHKMDEILSSARTQKERKEADDLVECGIWDFAGQQDYYATHQTFFTQHAIYLLVADIEDDIKPITHNEDDCYCIEDYIDFWFDSVHCFCKDHSADKLCPPVIMVCTGTDKFEKVEDRKKYTDKLYQNFGKERKFNHNRGIFFISNTQFTEEDKTEIEKLRKHISDIALDMNYFAEKLPTKWIQLETALAVLKDANIHVYSWDNMEKLAQKNSIDENDLFSFLNYQHQIGNLIFFKEISEYIILQPDWLVQCFRCLVCDCHTEKRNHNLICPTAWNELKNSGELSDLLINQLFQKEPELKFEDHKAHVLNVMEKFDIIIRLQVQDTSIDKSQKSDSYYLPCMIANSPSIKSIRDEFIPNNSNDVMTPWLVLEFIFLPFAFFNHILFHFIRKYKVCKVESIYKGKAVFYLDELSRFIICFSHNCISLQIWKWGFVEDNVYRTILNELCDNIESIQEKLRQNIYYSMKAKCSTGDYTKTNGRITLTDFISKDKYFCKEHRCPHNMEDMTNTWLKHAVEREKRNIIRKEPEIALHESLGADQVKAEGEERNIIKKEPEIALQGSLGADKVNDRYYKTPDQKGLVLIVNLSSSVIGFSILDEDMQNLVNFFKEELKYQVEIAGNPMTKTELQNYFMEFDRTYLVENSQDYHSFICVIIGYEDEGGIKTTDIPITIEEIHQIFKSKPGGKFNGKPKLFLIATTFGLNDIYDIHDQTESRHTFNSSFSLEKDADSLVAWSPNPVVIRSNALIASSFIGVFVSVAKNKYRDEHVEDILSDVVRGLYTNPEYPYAYKYFRRPKIKSALTKKCFL